MWVGGSARTCRHQNYGGRKAIIPKPGRKRSGFLSFLIIWFTGPRAGMCGQYAPQSVSGHTLGTKRAVTRRESAGGTTPILISLTCKNRSGTTILTLDQSSGGSANLVDMGGH